MKNELIFIKPEEIPIARRNHIDSRGKSFNKKEYNKEYYKKNKKYFKKYNKKYRENNKEEIRKYQKEYMKKYNKNNSERLKEYRKEYYKNNIEKVKEIHKKYYKNNTEKIKEKQKDWEKNNVEKMRKHRKEYNKERYKKPAVKKQKRKQYSKRRGLDFIELNKPLNDSDEAHHIDKVHVVYIPHKLHRSVYHNVFTGENMEEINDKVKDYFDNDLVTLKAFI